jgi:hypothetical protein
MRCASDKKGTWFLVGLWFLVSACQRNDQPAHRSGGGPRPAPSVSPTPVSPTPVDAGAASALDAGAASAPDAGVVCATGEARCGGYCATVATDPLHCGRCRNPCGQNQICAAGSCVSNVATVRDAGPVHCVGVQVQCGGYCATLAMDPLHCGRCDNRCARNQTCIAGQCTTSSAPSAAPSPGCPAPRMQCGLYCADLTNDPFHCGRCDNRCPSGQVCAARRCVAGENGPRPDAGPAARCVRPEVSCGAYCVNLTNDPFNCGRCANRCPTAQVCIAGLCVVPGTSSAAPVGTPQVPPAP